MFSKENLTKVASGGGFTIWHYRANAEEANAARNILGYFPEGVMERGDAVYITDNVKKTTHHWVDMNHAENKTCIWLFG